MKHHATEKEEILSVIKVVELVGTSAHSWEDAARQAVAEASHSLRHITGIDVIKHTARVTDGKISEYRTTLNVAFLVEHHSQIVGAPARSQ